MKIIVIISVIFTTYNMKNFFIGKNWAESTNLFLPFNWHIQSWWLHCHIEIGFEGKVDSDIANNHDNNRDKVGGDKEEKIVPVKASFKWKKSWYVFYQKS